MDLYSFGPNDLFIVGAGNLGALVIKKWREAFPQARVWGETQTQNKHEAIRGAGGIPVLRRNRMAGIGEVVGGCPNVLFCVAPGNTKNYSEEVEEAGKIWDPNRGGSFVFTSSGGVYSEQEGRTVNESSLVSEEPRVQNLIRAEKACLESGGNVLRLAGLYSLERGAHMYWLRNKVTDPDGVINLISYEDAASCVTRLLRRGGKGVITKEVFLVSDGTPMSRREICEAALKHPSFQGRVMPEYIQGTRGRGKVYDSTKVRERIGWVPMYPSFEEFMRQKGGLNREEEDEEEEEEEEETEEESRLSLIGFFGCSSSSLYDLVSGIWR